MVYIHVAYARVMMDHYSFSIGSKVRGHHVYKETWDQTIGEVMPCEREVGNSEDPLVVAMKKLWAKCQEQFHLSVLFF